MKKIIFAIISILAISKKIQTIDLAQDPRELTRNSLAACISKISENNFIFQDIITVTTPYYTPNESTLVINSKLESLLELNFSKKLKWTLLTRRSIRKENHINFTKKTHNYVIFFDDPNGVSDILAKISDIAWNPHAKFIIVSNEIYSNLTDVLEKIVISLWNQRAVNFIAMFPTARKNPVIPIYSWFPYRGGNCGNNYTNFKIINYCENGVFANATKAIFPKKIPNDLRGCPFFVRVVVWPPYVFSPPHLNRSQIGINFTDGIEIRMLNTIAEKCNFRVIYTVSKRIQDWGVLEPVSNASGLFLQLLNRKSDIGIGALAATINRYTYLDYSIPYTSESLTWCVPKARPESQWTSFIDIFNIEIWLGILSSYIFFSLFAFLTKFSNLTENRFYGSCVNCFLVLYQVFFSVSVFFKPINSNIRIIFIFWAIFCLILSAMYQTLLINFLVLPIYEKQIASVEDISEADLYFGYLPVYRNYFLPVEMDKESILINNKPYLCADADECLNHVAFSRNLTFAIPRLYLLAQESNFQDSRGKSQIYSFKDNYISFPVQFLCYKGFPLLKRINTIISRILTTGILAKWEKERKNMFRKKMAANSTKSETTNLSFNQLKGIFLIYLIGIFISFIVFLIEYLFYYYKNQETTYLE